MLVASRRPPVVGTGRDCECQLLLLQSWSVGACIHDNDYGDDDDGVWDLMGQALSLYLSLSLALSLQVPFLGPL